MDDIISLFNLFGYGWHRKQNISKRQKLQRKGRPIIP